METSKEPLGKSYDPAPIEDRWYEEWLRQGLFHADPASPGRAKPQAHDAAG